MKIKLKKALAQALSFTTIILMLITIVPTHVFASYNLSSPTYGLNSVTVALSVTEVVDEAPNLVYDDQSNLVNQNGGIQNESMSPEPAGQLVNWAVTLQVPLVTCGTTYYYRASYGYDPTPESGGSDGVDVMTSPNQTFNIPCGGQGTTNNRFTVQYGTSSTADSITVSGITVVDNSPGTGTPNLGPWNMEVRLWDRTANGVNSLPDVIRQITNVNIGTTYPEELFSNLQATHNYAVAVILYNDINNDGQFGVVQSGGGGSQQVPEETGISSPSEVVFNPLTSGGQSNTGQDDDLTNTGQDDDDLPNTGQDDDLPNTGQDGDDNNSSQPPTLNNPINVGSIQEFIAKLLDIALTIAIPIVALAIIYSGFLFVMARGNSEKLETAKQTLLYVIIGAALLLGAWVIANAIAGTIAQIQA